MSAIAVIEMLIIGGVTLLGLIAIVTGGFLAVEKGSDALGIESDGVWFVLGVLLMFALVSYLFGMIIRDMTGLI